MNKTNRLDDMDLLLYAAMPYAGKKEIEKYNSADTSEKLSDKAEQKIIKLLRREDKRIERENRYVKRHMKYSPIREAMRRVAVIVLVVMSVGFAGVLSIEAVRVEMYNAVVEWFDEYLGIRFTDETPSQVPKTILEYREPQLGEEYVRYEMKKNDFKYVIEYESDNALISYLQTVKSENSILKSNENTTVFDVNVHEYAGVITVYSVDDVTMTSITWQDEEYGYTLSSDLSKEELLVIAETVQ